MKKFQNNERINEGSEEKTLLDNLFNFYLLKYANRSISETEDHFLKAAEALEESGEVDKSSLDEFLEDKGIERKPKIKKSTRRRYGDG